MTEVELGQEGTLPRRIVTLLSSWATFSTSFLCFLGRALVLVQMCDEDNVVDCSDEHLAHPAESEPERPSQE